MRASSAILTLMTAAAACAAPSGPPQIVVDRTACDHCRMLISDVRMAAAYRATDGTLHVFDDPGCLRDAMASDPASAGATVWLQDFKGEGWVHADGAWLVHDPVGETPMGSGIRAFGDESSARAALREVQGGRLLDFAAFTASGDDR